MEYKASGTDSCASVQAVLETHELLETIISFLPSTQMFAVQRVSKAWHAVIARSSVVQEKMLLRYRETPRQNWNVKCNPWDLDDVMLVHKADDGLINSAARSHSTRNITPVALSPQLTCVERGMEYTRIVRREERIALDLLRGYAFRSHPSILDTYISNPACHHFGFFLCFEFDPPIPHVRYLQVDVRVKSCKVLKLWEALNKAMATRTVVFLVGESPHLTKRFNSVSASKVIDGLQGQHNCTAVLHVGKFEKGKSSGSLGSHGSYMLLKEVFIPSEQLWAKVNTGQTSVPHPLGGL